MRTLVVGVVVAGLLTFVLIPRGTTRVAAIQSDDVPVDGAPARQSVLAEPHDPHTLGALRVIQLPAPGESEEALAGRLGGTREGFVEAYGDPTLYLGPDLVSFETEDGGQALVVFARDRAVQVVLLPGRPEDKPSTEPDPADWSLDEASAVAQRFLPADAEVDETRSAPLDGGSVVVGCSTALNAALEEPPTDTCPGPSAAFGVRYTMPTEETVSAVTIALRDASSPGGTASSCLPTMVTGDDDAAEESGSRAVSEQNGIRVTFLGSELDAAGTESLPPGQRYVAVHVTIENRSDETFHFALDDFQVTDTGGQAYPAVCGGATPAITRGGLAPGELIRGSISFVVPENVEPEWFVYTRDGSTMRFGLP